MSKFIARFVSPFGKPATVARASGQVASGRAARRHPAEAGADSERELTDDEVAKIRAIHAPAGFRPSAPAVD